MKHKVFSSMLFLLMIIPVLGNTRAVSQDAVNVRIISDNGGSLQSIEYIRGFARQVRISTWKR